MRINNYKKYNQQPGSRSYAAKLRMYTFRPYYQKFPLKYGKNTTINVQTRKIRIKGTYGVRMYLQYHHRYIITATTYVPKISPLPGTNKNQKKIIIIIIIKHIKSNKCQLQAPEVRIPPQSRTTSTTQILLKLQTCTPYTKILL